MTALAFPCPVSRKAPVPPGVVGVHLAPEHDTRLVRYGWSQLLMAVGVHHAFVDGSAPAIYYGNDVRLGQSAVVWIRPDDNPKRPAIPGDVARATAYWLSLESEKNVSDRDEHGRVSSKHSVVSSHYPISSPPIHEYASLVADRLSESALHCEFVPRWPQGRTYAVALTHDVDEPERPGNAISHAWTLLIARDGGPRRAYWALAKEIREQGIAGAFGAKTHRREWDFRSFCEVEASLGLRSAFYFSTVNQHGGHSRDVSYDVNRRRYRRLLRRLNVGGWETGLHAAYHTYRQQPALSKQVRHLARFAPIHGVRHHYLRADPVDPMRTLTEHAAAGLMYDTSLGFNDAPGFRCGTALPFQPFSPSTGTIPPFTELPMTIADMHLPTHDVAAAVSMVRSHLAAVRNLGGLAVLNWHVGNWRSKPAWRESYIAACQMLAEDSGAWVATPSHIAKWWIERAAALSADTAATPASGPNPTRVKRFGLTTDMNRSDRQEFAASSCTHPSSASSACQKDSAAAITSTPFAI